MKYFNPDTGAYEHFELRAPGNYNADKVSEDTGTACKDPSLAQQNQRDEADINTIVKRFGITGNIPVIQLPPAIEDFADVFDMHSAMGVIARANQAFNALPPEARLRFDNNPAKFVDFIDDAYNSPDEAKRKRRMDELTELGLRLPETAQPAPSAPPAAPDPTATPAPRPQN